jgi:predicted lipoprotein
MKLISIGFTALVLTLTGCGGGSGGASNIVSDSCSDLNSDTFSCEQMLQDITAVVSDNVDTLVTDLTQLDDDIGNYCSSVQDSGRLDTAKTQWLAVMENVQQLEVMQFGLIKDARDSFYNWPLNDTCRVDVQIASDPLANFDTIANGRRGLNAVEYILFKPEVQDSCSSFASVSTWQDDNSPEEEKQARCGYAKRISADLVVTATALKAELVNYDITSEFTSLQTAANSISDALFYIDKQTKDAKIRDVIPQESAGSFNVGLLESQFAFASTAHLKNNLIGAKAILEAGLNDYLIASGQQSIATEMISTLDNAITNIDAISGNMNTAITGASDVGACINTAANGIYDGNSDIESFCALQFNIKQFTDLLKEDFTMILSFSKPAIADGDND